MATFHALRSCAEQGKPFHVGRGFPKGTCDTDALRENCERHARQLHSVLERHVVQLDSVLSGKRPPGLFVAAPADQIGADVQAEPTPTSQATTATATHSTRNVGARNASDVEELLKMKRLLAEKLGETRPAQSKQGKPFYAPPLSRMVLRTPGGVEEDSGCGTSPPSTRSMCSLLAEKLAETRPAQPKQGKPFHALLLSKTVLRTPGCVEEDSGCGTSPPSTPSMCSSRQESPRLPARVLMKDGLAYVVR